MILSFLSSFHLASGIPKRRLLQLQAIQRTPIWGLRQLTRSEVVICSRNIWRRNLWFMEKVDVFFLNIWNRWVDVTSRHLEDNDLGCQSISGIVSPLSPAGGRVNPCSTQDITFCEWGCVCAHVNAEKLCQRHSASANGPDGFPGRHVMPVFFFRNLALKNCHLPHIAKMGVVPSLCQRRNAPARVSKGC